LTRRPRGADRIPAGLVRGRSRVVLFFQAEDGIRDFHVTGVQTCALPISPRPAGQPRRQGPLPAGPRRRPAPGRPRLAPPPPGRRPPGRSRPRPTLREEPPRPSPAPGTPGDRKSVV